MTALEALEARVRAVLPEEYQDSYQELQPVSMGSAGLKFDATGRVAWNEIWGSFCDLAMAGGPPHKGALLAPGVEADIDAQADRYAEVVEELCRGVMMAAGLDAQPSPRPGWIRVECYGQVMADWLLRAIAMENVAVRREGEMIDLPAGPRFRLDKEIKNVITVIAKTSHYWLEHMSRTQQRAIAALFAEIAAESPVIEPDWSADAHASATLAAHVGEAIQQRTGLAPAPPRYAGWLGLACPTVGGAIWMMRAMAVSNVLARREETTLFVAINPTRDPRGERVIDTTARIYGLALAKGVLSSS
jgi:hypothetical protein